MGNITKNFDLLLISTYLLNYQGLLIHQDMFCRMFENRVPHMLDNDYTPYSALDIFVKDLVRLKHHPVQCFTRNALRD